MLTRPLPHTRLTAPLRAGALAPSDGSARRSTGSLRAGVIETDNPDFMSYVVP
jgi:hypothetical protein